MGAQPTWEIDLLVSHARDDDSACEMNRCYYNYLERLTKKQHMLPGELNINRGL
jgi:hypothetical protein